MTRRRKVSAWYSSPVRVALGVVLVAAASTCTETTGPVTPVYTITLDVDSVTVQLGDSVRLFATARDARGQLLQGQAVAWAEGNSLVARVNSAGWVFALQVGQSTISASSGRGLAIASVAVRLPRTTQVFPAIDTLRYIGSTVNEQATASDSSGPVSPG